MEKTQTTKKEKSSKADIKRKQLLFKQIKTGALLAAALGLVLFLLCSFICLHYDK